MSRTEEFGRKLTYRIDERVQVLPIGCWDPEAHFLLGSRKVRLCTQLRAVHRTMLQADHLVRGRIGSKSDVHVIFKTDFALLDVENAGVGAYVNSHRDAIV